MAPLRPAICPEFDTLLQALRFETTRWSTGRPRLREVKPGLCRSERFLDAQVNVMGLCARVDVVY